MGINVDLQFPAEAKFIGNVHFQRTKHSLPMGKHLAVHADLIFVFNALGHKENPLIGGVIAGHLRPVQPAVIFQRFIQLAVIAKLQLREAHGLTVICLNIARNRNRKPLTFQALADPRALPVLLKNHENSLQKEWIAFVFYYAILKI